MKAGYNVFEAKIIQYIFETELLFLNKLSFCFLLFLGVSKVIECKKTAGWGYFKERNPKHNLLKCITSLYLKFTNS